MVTWTSLCGADSFSMAITLSHELHHHTCPNFLYPSSRLSGRGRRSRALRGHQESPWQPLLTTIELETVLESEGARCPTTSLARSTSCAARASSKERSPPSGAAGYGGRDEKEAEL
jgi:hypothetical protein